MILDALKIENLSYEILEGSDRIGGRVYTHYFPRRLKDPKKSDGSKLTNQELEESKETHNYYDVSLFGPLENSYMGSQRIQVGAMRFPKIPIMEK